MEPLVVTIPHSLGKDEALRRLRPALSKASETFPALKVDQEDWSENRLDFRVRALGQIVTGMMEVGDREICCQVMLPWLLHRFAAATQKVLSARGRALLEKK